LRHDFARLLPCGDSRARPCAVCRICAPLKVCDIVSAFLPIECWLKFNIESNILHWNAIPTVTNVDAFEDAVEAFKRGGSRSEYLRELLALGLPAIDIRFLAECRGRTMTVRER
jgi:hypothetical protein